MSIFHFSGTFCAILAAFPILLSAAAEYKNPFNKQFTQLIDSNRSIFDYNNNTLDIKLAANEKSGTFVLFFPCKSSTDYVISGQLASNNTAVRIRVFGSDGTQYGDFLSDAEKKSSALNVKFNSGTAVGVKIYVTADSASGGSAAIRNIAMRSVVSRKSDAGASATAGKNIARNRSYTLTPAPNCKRLFAANDRTKLTDGKFSGSTRIWTDQGHAVGWEGGKLACVSIDLGSVKPIHEVAWCTAGGIAGVVWPSIMPLCVSNDGKNWSLIGDIRKIGTTPPPLGNMTKVRFAATNLRAEGRFVAILARSPYLFCEEIEIIEGSINDGINPDSFPISGTPWEYFSGQQNSQLVQKRFIADADAIKSNMAAVADSELKKKLLSRINDQLKKIEQAALPLPEKAILPLHAPHRELLKINAEVMRKRGINEPTLWCANRWDNTLLTSIPKASKYSGALNSVEMMQNEIRSLAVNISNPTDSDIAVDVALIGFPAALNARLCEVLATDTPSRNATSSALKNLPQGGSLEIPAGVTRQIWVYIDRPQIPGGRYTGKLQVKLSGGKTLAQDLQVRVSKLKFPESTSLLLGGFDYDSETKANRAEQLEFMKNMYVNISWRSSQTLPSFKFDAQGKLVNEAELDWSKFDKWVTERPYIRGFYYFSNVAKGGIANALPGTARGNRIIGDYYRAIGKRMKHLGLASSQFTMHPLDEPKTPEMYKMLLIFAEAFKKADAGVSLFNDPIRDYVNPLGEKALSYCDIICPDSRDLMLPGEGAVQRRKLIEKFRKAGKTTQIYSCDGPAKELDPISYHRYQMYLAAELNMNGCHYWTFGPGINRQASLNAYKSGQFTDYLPFYSTPEGLLDAKHAQAIREGVQDYEYVTMIRKKIAEMRRNGETAAADKSETALDKILSEVSSTVRYQSRAEIHWTHPHDHVTMDNAQRQLLRLLEKLEQ